MQIIPEVIGTGVLRLPVFSNVCGSHSLTAIHNMTSFVQPVGSKVNHHEVQVGDSNNYHFTQGKIIEA